MTKAEMYQPVIEKIAEMGKDLGLLRLKVETAHFDFVFELDSADNEFKLMSTKAVIRAVGKVTKVKLESGDTWEQAYERVREHWSNYFKEYRSKAKPDDASRAKDRVRAKRYRSNKAAEEAAFLERG